MQSVTDELLEKIRDSLLENHKEWAFNRPAKDGKPGDEAFLRCATSMVSIRWEDEPRFKELLFVDVGDVNYVHTISLSGKQKKQLRQWRDDWKATFALRKMLGT